MQKKHLFTVVQLCLRTTGTLGHMWTLQL